MTQDLNDEFAQMFDCGDGVPALNILTDTTATAEDEPAEDGPEPVITARVAAILATVVGQLAIGLTIVLGGNPIVGGFAAIMLMICGLALALAEVADAAQK